VELRFRAMGSDAHVIVVGGAPVLGHRAVAWIDDLERRWSRFLPDSEVCELNRSAGRPVVVSSPTALLVERAVGGHRLSGGSFDPTVLGDLLRAGYDRSFDELTGRTRRVPSFLAAGCERIRIDGCTVTLPPEVGFDPGGIGKGLAADLVTSRLLEAGARGACVNLGGDVRLRGCGPTGGSWTVALEHPATAAPIAKLGLHEGAVATSTTLRRRWRTAAGEAHHLIDPGTGQPSTSDLTFVSVVTEEAWRAEILAKAILLRGSTHPFDLIGDLVGDGTATGSAAALVVDRAGRVQTSSGFADFTRGSGPDLPGREVLS
jgi:thiamine biosynthesis lipoprotein